MSLRIDGNIKQLKIYYYIETKTLIIHLMKK
jgi:hypothetical protein